VYATLLEEGQYLGHWRTYYRILSAEQQVRERRDQLHRPVYQKPQLLATSPNQVWSWDITKLFGPYKWTYFYLYVILDIYSRYVVGWTIGLQEAAHVAEALVAETCRKQGIVPGQLTLHADRGIPMTSKPLAFLLADLGVTKTHSRPSVSNDNPFSEAQFKTMKYCPAYPDRFGSLLDAQAWARYFFTWYNQYHHHSALNLLTPAQVHYGEAVNLLLFRQNVLQRAFEAHPERFVRGAPKAGQLPDAVWINPPQISPLVEIDDPKDSLR
jgi:putative transposase